VFDPLGFWSGLYETLTPAFLEADILKEEDKDGLRQFTANITIA
jgi:hypothetical protein